MAINHLHTFVVHCTTTDPILRFRLVRMDQYQPADIDQFARMNIKIIKTQAKEWLKEQEAQLHKRLTKKVEKFRKEEEARSFREFVLGRFFGDREAPKDLDQRVEAFRVAQETSWLHDLDTQCKEKETQALRLLQQDVRYFKAQEASRPLQGNRSRRPKPSRSYYWPQESPSAWDTELPTRSREKTSARVVAPRLKIPRSIILTPPDSEPEYSPHARPEEIDTSLLSPADAQRIPSTSQRRTSSKSQARKPRGMMTDGHRAPKPSLFSYDVCVHPQCPLTCCTHERGVFLYPSKYVTDEEYASAFTTFQNGNPPPRIWDAYLNAMDDLRASGGDTKAVSQEDIEIVRGFVAAHPMP